MTIAGTSSRQNITATAIIGSGSVCDRIIGSVIEPRHCKERLRHGNPGFAAQNLVRTVLDCRADAGSQ